MGDVPDRLKPFFAELDAIEAAQPALVEGGDLAIFPAQRKMFVMPENQGDLDLDALAADAPGQGWGGAMLAVVAALADKHGLTVYLRALAQDEGDEDALDQDGLERFYAAHGFVGTGSWGARDMLRRPRPLSEEASLLLDKAVRGEAVWTPPGSRNAVRSP